VLVCLCLSICCVFFMGLHQKGGSVNSGGRNKLSVPISGRMWLLIVDQSPFMTTLFEIIELPNGDIALRRADESGEPLVSIRFSKESLYFLNDSKIDIAKAMIEAGLEAAGDVQEVKDEDTAPLMEHTVH